MQYVRDCVLYDINISVNWDWSGIGNQLKGIIINFAKCFRVITFETPIVFKTGTNVPAFQAMVIPSALIFTPLWISTFVPGGAQGFLLKL